MLRCSDGQSIHSLFFQSLYFLTFFGLWCIEITKGWNTLGDKFKRNVAMTNHFLCTGPAKSCSNTLAWQITWCVLESQFVWKSLSLQQNFVAATSCKNSNDTEIVWLVAGTKLCCSRDKYFHKNYPQNTKQFVAVMCRHDMLLQLDA